MSKANLFAIFAMAFIFSNCTPNAGNQPPDKPGPKKTGGPITEKIEPPEIDPFDGKFFKDVGTGDVVAVIDKRLYGLNYAPYTPNGQAMDGELVTNEGLELKVEDNKIIARKSNYRFEVKEERNRLSIQAFRDGVSKGRAQFEPVAVSKGQATLTMSDEMKRDMKSTVEFEDQLPIANCDPFAQGPAVKMGDWIRGRQHSCYVQAISDGYTPSSYDLYVAVDRNNWTAIEHLISVGKLDPNELYSGRSPLHRALESLSLFGYQALPGRSYIRSEIAQLIAIETLLDQGALPSSVTGADPAIHHLLQHTRISSNFSFHHETIDKILDHGGYTDTKSSDGHTVLTGLLYTGMKSNSNLRTWFTPDRLETFIRKVITLGANINEKTTIDSAEATAVSVAIQYGVKETVELLIGSLGADHRIKVDGKNYLEFVRAWMVQIDDATYNASSEYEADRLKARKEQVEEIESYLETLNFGPPAPI